MRPDWLATVTRVLARLPRLVRALRPTFELPDVRHVDLAFLRRHGIRGVVWDVDGTLMGYHAAAVDPALRPHLDALLGADGLRHAIVSNCDEARFTALAHILPAAVVVRVYASPAGSIARHVVGGVDTHAAAHPPAGTAVRKPSAALIEAAAAALGGIPMDALLVVGDQYFTDVASANLAGARSVKVRTYRPESFPAAVRVGQRLETLVARLSGRARPAASRPAPTPADPRA